MEQWQKGMVIGGTRLLYQAAALLEQSGRVNEIELYLCNRNGFGGRREESTQWKSREISVKKDLMELLAKETDKTLVLSVMNPWLFTEEALANPNIFVINLHHALLPAHRGRNAEAWAIYEGDEKAGITWHRVDNGIDTGAVFLQKEVEIGEKTTSLKLLAQLNEAALEGLGELLQGDFEERPPLLQAAGKGKLHLSKDIPNDGWLDLSWDCGQISRFLRSMDYGVLDVFGKPRVRLDDGVYVWKAWKIQEAEPGSKDGITFCQEKQELLIQKEGCNIVLRRMEKEK